MDITIDYTWTDNSGPGSTQEDRFRTEYRLWAGANLAQDWTLLEINAQDTEADSFDVVGAPSADILDLRIRAENAADSSVWDTLLGIPIPRGKQAQVI